MFLATNGQGRWFSNRGSKINWKQIKSHLYKSRNGQLSKFSTCGIVAKKMAKPEGMPTPPIFVKDKYCIPGIIPELKDKYCVPGITRMALRKPCFPCHNRAQYVKVIHIIASGLGRED